MAFYHDATADMAYQASRDSFEEYRGRLVEKAVDAHEKGDDTLAHELLERARTLVYTGLMWQQDNGIGEEHA